MDGSFITFLQPSTYPEGDYSYIWWYGLIALFLFLAFFTINKGERAVTVQRDHLEAIRTRQQDAVVRGVPRRSPPRQEPPREEARPPVRTYMPKPQEDARPKRTSFSERFSQCGPKGG